MSPRSALVRLHIGLLGNGVFPISHEVTKSSPGSGNTKSSLLDLVDGFSKMQYESVHAS